MKKGLVRQMNSTNLCGVSGVKRWLSDSGNGTALDNRFHSYTLVE
jgi:hypothetical protein